MDSERQKHTLSPFFLPTPPVSLFLSQVRHVPPAAYLRHPLEVRRVHQLRPLLHLLPRRQAPPQAQVLQDRHHGDGEVRPGRGIRESDVR